VFYPFQTLGRKLAEFSTSRMVTLANPDISRKFV